MPEPNYSELNSLLRNFMILVFQCFKPYGTVNQNKAQKQRQNKKNIFVLKYKTLFTFHPTSIG